MSILDKLFGSKKRASKEDKAFQDLFGGMFGEGGNASTEHFVPKGKFGYEKSNPVMAKGISNGYAYLNRLECANGDPVAYNRIGSMMSGNEQLPKLMDGYTITNARTGSKICTLYVYGYSHETSAKAPEGFRFK
jgi:hypothetical protein